MSIFGQECIVRNSPVTICIARQIPNSDPEFHRRLIVDGVGRSTKTSFACTKYITDRHCLAAFLLRKVNNIKLTVIWVGPNTLVGSRNQYLQKTCHLFHELDNKDNLCFVDRAS